VLDVRDDGGGSYQLLLISLDFIEGPIVQIKSAGRKKRGFV
jgi:C-terminal processing protease CtpA/Prc